MSTLFYEATRVVMDGRLSRMFRGVRAKGEHAGGTIDQNLKVVEAVVAGYQLGKSTLDIAESLNISRSSVEKIKGLNRDRCQVNGA